MSVTRLKMEPKTCRDNMDNCFLLKRMKYRELYQFVNFDKNYNYLL